MLSAIHIAHNQNHPMLQAFGATPHQAAQVLNELLAILTQRRRLNRLLVNACKAANNDPDQLITTILAYLT